MNIANSYSADEPLNVILNIQGSITEAPVAFKFKIHTYI